MNIMIMGPAGSGKTTQGKLLAEYLGIPHFSAGDLFRYSSLGKSKFSDEIKSKVEKGEFVDDNLTVQLIEEHLKGKSHLKGTVIDGFPRNLTQARRFSVPVDKVIYLKVSDKETTRRLLQRGRKDDKPRLIKKRLEIYHRETEPILEFYRERGILEELEGEQGIEEIAKQIRERING